MTAVDTTEHLTPVPERTDRLHPAPPSLTRFTGLLDGEEPTRRLAPAPAAPPAPPEAPAPTTSDKPLLPPSFVPFLLAAAVALVVSLAWYAPRTTILGWVLTVVWSLPALSAVLGLWGAYRTRGWLRTSHTPVPPVLEDTLLVVVPTIGRTDTYPALARVVASYAHHLPAYFPNLRIDVVVEEGCEAMPDITAMVAGHASARLVTVPASYSTRRGTRFKARANHYANQLRCVQGEDRADVWVLHMDDDTGVSTDTAREVARFLHTQRATETPRHLAQGVLTYPADIAVNRWTWYADAVRPADDVARFAAFTGGGHPLAGVHGELLLVRGNIEASIGWDFGPTAIVEDAEFAMRFATRYPGRSGWFPGRCYGASPATVRDLIKQRRRWSAGLVALALRGSIPLRARALLAYSVSTWVLGPLQHIVCVLGVSAILGTWSTSPVAPWVTVLWALNMGYVVWMYWSGLRINVRATGMDRPSWGQRLVVLALVPVCALWEGLGGLLGFWDFLRGRANTFVVIQKPA